MIEVRVEEPREVRVRVGSPVTFVCTATSKVSNVYLRKSLSVP